jgi:thymidylate synthase (FAD)
MSKYKKPETTLLFATPLNIGEVSARICYDSFVASEDKQIQDFPKTKSLGEPIQKSNILDKLSWVYFHESVLEHISLSYHIGQISREVIIEMNRHRVGIATSQRSTRYTIEHLVDAWITYRDSQSTTNFNNYVDVVRDNIVITDNTVITHTARYIHECLNSYNQEEELQLGLKGSRKKAQNDRVKRCLPETWLVEGIWTFNLRALKHFLKLRNSNSAYYGIREVAEGIIDATPKEYLSLIMKEYR